MPRKIKQYKNPFFKGKHQMVQPVASPPQNIQDAIAFHRQGKLGQAEAIYRQILGISPLNADALHLLGVIANQTGHHQAAIDLIGQALEINPNDASYHSNRGNAQQKLKQFDAAVSSYERAIELKPDYADAYSNRGISLQKLGKLDAAVDSYKSAIELCPDFAEAYSNLGNAMIELKQFEDAIASYEKAIELKPDYYEGYSNRGNALHKLKQFESAVASYDKAIELKPDYADAFSNRGIALQKLKQFEAAVNSYEKAIELKPDFADAYANLGNALQEFKQLDAAVANYEKAIELNSNNEYLYGVRQHAKMYICDWQNFERTSQDVILKIQKQQKASNPFSVLAFVGSLPDQLMAAETWITDKYPYNHLLGPIKKSLGQSKIRIGYYSADFHLHPVSILTVGMFEHHDKSNFELIAFSFGPDSHDEIRGRIDRAFNKFIDVRGMSDKDVALLSRSLGVDIAVDLGGHTQDSRTGIFSYRAAPIQLSYIGYLGTMGASYYDYLIADQTLIPKKYQTFYSEKIAYLPCYQVNDNKQEIASDDLSRRELNLPESGFVFCSFNSNYKITPSIFDGWMRILKAVPDSVLLIYTDLQSANKNLKREAEKREVNSERLIFCERLVRSQYMSRCRLADLFLDTSPYNAGATASDALWAGLPILTCMGESFSSRYAASLLYSIGVPELVTETQAEYEALAIELATNDFKLRSIKDKLERNRLTAPLYDTQRFTKNIEAAYKEMYKRYRDDLPPDHIYVTEVDPINFQVD
jgi:predicted O-linked N-acetylglucosamine transferase (SPINDLY family)